MKDESAGKSIDKDVSITDVGEPPSFNPSEVKNLEQNKTNKKCTFGFIKNCVLIRHCQFVK